VQNSDKEPHSTGTNLAVAHCDQLKHIPSNQRRINSLTSARIAPCPHRVAECVKTVTANSSVGAAAVEEERVVRASDVLGQHERACQDIVDQAETAGSSHPPGVCTAALEVGTFLATVVTRLSCCSVVLASQCHGVREIGCYFRCHTTACSCCHTCYWARIHRVTMPATSCIYLAAHLFFSATFCVHVAALDLGVSSTSRAACRSTLPSCAVCCVISLLCYPSRRQERLRLFLQRCDG
jgi:hypothetical protein